jgi:PPK2 family polyphosphate:nucleotide phosphotransferase
MNYQDFLVSEGERVRLVERDADFTEKFKNKEEAAADLDKSRERISALQEMLYAEDKQALLVVFQAMDAAGKDSTIKHVFAGLSPAGIEVTPFKPPTSEELDHDFLWRAARALPARGKIGVFSRSYYEEVLVVRVHKEILRAQQLTDEIKNDGKIWQHRLEDIRNWERYLARNGVHVLKFFLHISRDEQKRQLMERIEEPEKHWKFSFGDLEDRRFWDDYMNAYEEAFAATSTPDAPWYVIPGNKRWFARAVIARIVAEKLESLNLSFPTVTDEQKRQIEEARKILENE